MKELTIEQKAQRYDEAIEKLRDFYRDYDTVSRLIDVKEELANLFPELKESEDERIKKEMLTFFKGFYDNQMVKAVDVEPWIAWLEKQGEQKPADKIQLGKKYKCIASPRYSAFVKGEIYKPEDKFLCSLMNFCSDCFEPIEDGEKKSADKAESNLLTVERAKEMSPFMRSGFENEYAAWSEEDEKEVAVLEAYICSKDWSERHIDRALGIVDELVNKVKFLRPQKQWKPSEKQIKVCKEVYADILSAKGFDLGTINSELNRLEEELKKLKG